MFTKNADTAKTNYHSRRRITRAQEGNRKIIATRIHELGEATVPEAQEEAAYAANPLLLGAFRSLLTTEDMWQKRGKHRRITRYVTEY